MKHIKSIYEFRKFDTDTLDPFTEKGIEKQRNTTIERQKERQREETERRRRQDTERPRRTVRPDRNTPNRQPRPEEQTNPIGQGEYDYMMDGTKTAPAKPRPDTLPGRPVRPERPTRPERTTRPDRNTPSRQPRPEEQTNPIGYEEMIDMFFDELEKIKDTPKGKEMIKKIHAKYAK